MSRSTSGPASRRIRRRWPRRSSLTTWTYVDRPSLRAVDPANCSAMAAMAAVDNQLEATANSSRAIQLGAPLAGRAGALQARHRPHPMPSGRWSRSSRAPGVRRGNFRFVRITAGGIAPVPLRLAAAEAAAAGDAPANVATAAKVAEQAIVGCQATADDGLQTRPAQGPGAGPAGAAGGIDLRGDASMGNVCERRQCI